MKKISSLLLTLAFLQKIPVDAKELFTHRVLETQNSHHAKNVMTWAPLEDHRCSITENDYIN